MPETDVDSVSSFFQNDVETAFAHEGEEFGTTVSLGMVTIAGANHEFDTEALLAAADQALEAAKRGGTNRIQLVEMS